MNNRILPVHGFNNSPYCLFLAKVRLRFSDICPRRGTAINGVAAHETGMTFGLSWAPTLNSQSNLSIGSPEPTLLGDPPRTPWLENRNRTRKKNHRPASDGMVGLRDVDDPELITVCTRSTYLDRRATRRRCSHPSSILRTGLPINR